MAYCGPRGIRYAHFLEWDQLSRDAALAWSERERAKCHSCGQVHDDWTEVGEDGKRVEITPEPFEVVQHWCPGCDRLARARRAAGDELPDGVHLAFAASDPNDPDRPTVDR